MTEEQKAKIEVFANELVASEFKVDDDGYLRHIRSGCFNGNGLLEPISIDCLEEKIKACAAYGIELCESENKMLRDIIIIASEKGTNIEYCSRIEALQAEIRNLQIIVADYKIGAEQNEIYIRLHEENTKLRSLITEMGKALELTQDHCLCNRNTYGFDYNETHRNLGKPEAGKRWLDPYDICANALELKEKVLKEIDTP